MSMLSSQADELREKADILDGLEGMDNLVSMLREAADTIISLRDRLQAVGETCEEIVRCRDCEYYHDGKNTDGKRYVEPHCLAIGELAYGAIFDVDEDDFCSWAERREQ